MDSWSNNHSPGLDHFEEGRVDRNLNHLEELLQRGEAFDIWYKEENADPWDREKTEEDIEPFEAINYLLERANEFDRYTTSWNNIGQPDSIRVYSNNREGLLGRILPKRGEEIIFTYRGE